jgi:outer membrane protein OmpA-like peptidoglycan-associated protein
MKIQALVILACTASLFAQEAAPAASAPTAETKSCEASFDAVKNTYPRDASADRIYASVNARVTALKNVEEKKRSGAVYEAELKNCDLAVELFKAQLSKVALQRNLDSLLQKNLEVQKEISAIKDTLIDIWASDAKGAKSLNAALNEERNRLERLNREKDSLLAVQKAEAEKKLNALQSKTINVYKDARGTILAMSDILFERGKAELTQELQLNLAEVAAILKSLLTESNVEVEGHTDNDGSAQFNLSLSKQRAEAVSNYLVGRGVEKKRLKAIGYGLTKPICPANDTDECKAKNRRVELVIKDK